VFTAIQFHNAVSFKGQQAKFYGKPFPLVVSNLSLRTATYMAVDAHLNTLQH